MILYFEIEREYGIQQYSLLCDLDWLEEYTEKEGFGDLGTFLKEYNSEDVNKIVNALDCDNQPYTIQEEHSFFGSMD